MDSVKALWLEACWYVQGTARSVWLEQNKEVGSGRR